MKKFLNSVRAVLVLALVVVLLSISGRIMAAEIDPVYERINGNKRGIFWEQINNDDSAGEATWRGGCGLFEAAGTQATADFELQWGSVSGALQDIDSGLAPDSGIHFTSATGLGMVRFNLPIGYVDIKFTSAGHDTQDLDIRAIPMSCD